ncbi:MAG: energy-coupled thiamine transporter ThiT, partial [Lachnospiraceae bacterium]|nr:energy-coupled thiamine transporter ThiT [Lachnospiraceae bacterium]
SGYIFFKEYAPENINPILYTVVYNGSYIFIECILSLVLIYIKPIKRIINISRMKWEK